MLYRRISQISQSTETRALGFIWAREVLQTIDMSKFGIGMMSPSLGIMEAAHLIE